MPRQCAVHTALGPCGPRATVRPNPWLPILRAPLDLAAGRLVSRFGTGTPVRGSSDDCDDLLVRGGLVAGGVVWDLKRLPHRNHVGVRQGLVGDVLGQAQVPTQAEDHGRRQTPVGLVNESANLEAVACYLREGEWGSNRRGGAVREEARRQGEEINKSRPAALAVVKDIMDWADEGGGERARPPLAQAGEGEDWVDALCTWERYMEGLRKTRKRKGVGVDGFNAYLLQRAPEVVRRAYWEAG